VGEGLLGVVVCFNRHHGAEAGGLDGWDAAADIGGRELRLGYLAWLGSLLRDGRFELERVFYRVDG
jgi:ketosteroid isomerase-like protein